MTLIEHPERVKFTGEVLTVIVHDYSHEWHCYKMFLTEYEVTTLADISNNFPNVEMLIAENPLNGKIYRFNNYKDNKWYETGKTDGYA